LGSKRKASGGLEKYKYWERKKPYKPTTMLANYIRLAWRNMFVNKQFAFLNLVGLSTGLASAILIYLWVIDETRVDKFNEKDSRLYKVLANMSTPNEVLTLHGTPYPLGAALTKEMPEVEHAVSLNHFIDWFAGAGVASIGNNHIKAKGYLPLVISSMFFRIGFCRAIDKMPWTIKTVLSLQNG
jgi:hypothetical protein